MEDFTEEEPHEYWVYDPMFFEDPGFSYEWSDLLVSWDYPGSKISFTDFSIFFIDSAPPFLSVYFSNAYHIQLDTFDCTKIANHDCTHLLSVEAKVFCINKDTSFEGLGV